MEKVYLEKSKIYYNNARQCIKDNNPKLSREYVLELLDLYKILYAESHPSEKNSIVNNIMLWLRVSQDLRSKGVTDFVLSMFALNKEDMLSNDDWQAKIFKDYVSAVVRIKCTKNNYVINGTGFFISSQGYFLTNEHVVFDEDEDDSYDELFLSFYQDTIQYPFQIIVTDKENDIALCKVNLEFKPQYISFLEDINRISPGNELLLIGNPFGMDLCPSDGTIRYVRAKDNENNLISTIPSNPGDSGGPVLIRSGECVGINKAILASVTRENRKENARGITQATRSDVVLKFLKKWEKEYDLCF